MSLDASHWPRVHSAAAFAIVLASSVLLASCGSTGAVAPFSSPPADGGVPAEASGPPPSTHALPVECGPFGPSRLARFADVQTDPHLVIADFNCDGYPDALTTGISPGDTVQPRVQLRPGNGDGTFGDGSAISFDLDAIPSGMVAGDFNGDGAPDFVLDATSTNGQSTLLFYRGSCAAEAWSPETLASPSPYLGTGMVVADMNGDGADDLVLARAAWPMRIAVMLGGGQPFDHVLMSDMFSDATPAGRINAIATGDFDGDRRRDVVAVTGKGMDILLGNGDGTLTDKVHFSSTWGWFAVKAADLYGYGRDEIITLSSPRELSGTFVIDYNYDPDYGSLSGVALYQQEGADQLQVADLDGDTRPDVVVAGPADQDSPSALLLSSRGIVELPVTQGALRLGDVTGDGQTDLVYLAPYGFEVYPHLQSCPTQPATCESGATFREARTRLDGTPKRLLFGDVTGNGAQDVVAVGNRLLELLYNDGSGQLAHGPDVNMDATGVALADIDGDGADEIVAVDGSTGWTVIRGDASWYHVQPAGFPKVTNVFSGDFNGDLEDDLAFANRDGFVIVPSGDPALYFRAGVLANPLAAVDYNYDGRTDLLFLQGDSYSMCVVYGPMTEDSVCQPIDGPFGFADIADFDGDHLPDLVYARTSLQIDLWTRQSQTRTLLAPDYGWLDAHVLKRGSAPASLLVAAKGGALAVYAGNGDGSLGPGAPVSVQQSARPLALVATHDLDGDGVDEIFTATGGPDATLSAMYSCRPSPPTVY